MKVTEYYCDMCGGKCNDKAVGKGYSDAHLFELTTALQQIGVKDITTEAETLDTSPIKNKPWLLTRFTAYGTINE